MKHLILLFCLLNSAIPSVDAQDLITKKTGEDIRAIVLEVGISEVRYRNYDNQGGPVYVLAKKDILLIRYQNGSKDIFPEALQEPAKPPVNAGSDTLQMTAEELQSMQQKGIVDAELNYSSRRSGAGWVLATNIVTSPLIGLIPAVACASNEPQPQNLNAPDPALMKNPAYQRAYTQEAHRIKKRAIWSSYAAGAVVWVFLAAVFY